MCRLVEKCWKRPNLTFGDLWWSDLWPDQKIDQGISVINFYALSIAVYRTSLRGPGAELQGGVKTPLLPARHGKHRPPARRELTSRWTELPLSDANMLYVTGTACGYFVWALLLKKGLKCNPVTGHARFKLALYFAVSVMQVWRCWRTYSQNITWKYWHYHKLVFPKTGMHDDASNPWGKKECLLCCYRVYWRYAWF